MLCKNPSASSRNCSETVQCGLRNSLFSTKLQSPPLWCLCICAAVFLAAVIFQPCGGFEHSKGQTQIHNNTQKQCCCMWLLLQHTAFRFWHISHEANTGKSNLVKATLAWSLEATFMCNLRKHGALESMQIQVYYRNRIIRNLKALPVTVNAELL